MSKAIGNVTEISSCKDNHAKDQGQDSKPNVTRYKNGKPLDHSSYEHGSAIKEARIAANVKQEDLGIFLGDNPKGTISSIEKNLFAPRIEYLAPIAYRLHMKAEDIVGVKSDAVDPEDELSIEEREAILLYRSMTEAQQ